MSAIHVYLFLHVASAFVLVSAAAITMTLTVMLRKSRNTQAIAMLLGLRARTMISGFIGALGALIFGSLLADKQALTNPGWIKASYITWFVMLVVFVIGFFATRAARKVVKSELDAGHTESQAASDAVNKPMIMLPVMVVNVLILVFLYLMTFKPGM